MIGVSHQSIKQTLNAPSVTTSTLEKISSALGVPMWQLFADPNNIGRDELTAFVEFRGELYKAHSVAELEQLVKQFKG